MLKVNSKNNKKTYNKDKKRKNFYKCQGSSLSGTKRLISLILKTSEF